MKAVGLTRYLPISDPESLIDIELDKPTPAGRDLLVKIAAIAVNPVDTKVRAPKDTIEQTPRVLGWDAAGVVEAVGPEVTLFKAGDHVYYAGDITRQGANSEFHLVDERVVGAKPESLDFTPRRRAAAHHHHRMGSALRPVARVGGRQGRGQVGARHRRAGASAPSAFSSPSASRSCR